MKSTLQMLWLLLAVLALAACQPEIPALPEVTVNVTAVNDQAALDDAVALALTGTAEQVAFATETALALGGVTLTPTQTPTATNTPLPPTETPFLSPTPSPTPTNTVTPTFAPPATSQPPVAVAERAGGRVRVLHAWRGEAVDVYIDDMRIYRGLRLGGATPYFNTAQSTVRIVIDEIPVAPGEPTPEFTRPTPIISQVVEIPATGSLSVLLVDMGGGLRLLPVPDNLSPLSAGESRLQLVQTNAGLLRSNVVLPNAETALAYDMALGDMPGPFDLPVGQYQAILYDAESPEERLAETVFELQHYTSQLAVFIPPPPDVSLNIVTDVLIFTSSTNRAAADTSAFFVNGAVDAGEVNIALDRQTVWTGLGTGTATLPIPISNQGALLAIVDAESNRGYYGVTLNPFPEADLSLNRIVVLIDGPGSTPDAPSIVTATFLQDPRPNPLRASLRLINALGGTNRPLDLEIRATNPVQIENAVGVPQSQQASSAWTPIAQGVSVGAASEYEVRSPNLFDVRLVISGTQIIQATLQDVQLVPGGIYDFVVVPGGDGVGTARLLILQPDVFSAVPGASQDINAIIGEQVQAALTASAPAITATPTLAATASPTISPVPTNTPRPTSTPRIPPAALEVRPAPPNAVYDGDLVVRGVGFVPGQRYTLQIDGGADLQSGRTEEDGTLETVVDLPATLAPGPHVVSVCVDCRLNGANQQAFTTFLLAAPDVTPTATPQP